MDKSPEAFFSPVKRNQQPGPVQATLDKSTDQIAAISSPGGTITFPFQIYNTSTAMTQQVHVRYGTVNDVEPVNVDTDIPLSVDGTYVLYLDININLDGAMLTATLDTATPGPQPVDTDYDGYITLGTVTVSGGQITTINQAATHSLRFAMCGRIVTTGVLTFRGTYEFWGF